MDGSEKGFRGLRVWQDGMDLAADTYRLTAAFPVHERYGLAGQMQRAATSIPANIAEGHSRSEPGDYARHVNIARGSLGELETFLELATRLDYADAASIAPLLDRCAAIGRQLYRLHAYAESRRRRPDSP